ncbi:MAG TPA: ion transporter [Sphingobacteriaceae bacterium]
MKQPDQLSHERNRLLTKIERILEAPMIVLAFVWLVLLIVELSAGLNRSLELLAFLIWIVFIIDFVIKVILASHKGLFFKKNWLTAVSLIVPAFRIFRAVRFLRLIRTLRGARLIKVVASLNRGMRTLNATMKRRGFGYVMLLSLFVIFAGAAGMFAFENRPGGIESYSTALWWTTMLIITIGSDYWPVSAEGRILCVLLSVYGFAVFGYITATLASFFIGRDAEEKDAPLAGTAEIEAMRKEIAALSQIIRKNLRETDRE